MDEYLAAIVEELQATWSTPVSPRTIRLEAEALRIHTDKAVSLGVIVNELVSNACKYAYGEGEPGEVRVRFKRDPSSDVEKFMLEVEDDGCGLSDEGPKGTGVGAKLISAMAHSLSSKMTYDQAHSGCRAVLVAPL
jgi:two-component sensor histidine kinase